MEPACAAPAPPPDRNATVQERCISEQEVRIKALERERAKLKDLADQEEASTDDWKDRALVLVVGRFAREIGEVGE